MLDSYQYVQVFSCAREAKLDTSPKYGFLLQESLDFLGSKKPTKM